MNSDPTTPTRDDRAWGACPAGAITLMTKQVATQQRRRRAIRIAGVAASGAALLAVVLLTAVYFRMGSHGGIYCPECRSHFSEYATYLEGQAPRKQIALSDEMISSMRIHLANCPRCRKKFQAAYPSMLNAQANVASSLRIATWQPRFSADFRQRAW